MEQDWASETTETTPNSLTFVLEELFVIFLGRTNFDKIDVYMVAIGEKTQIIIIFLCAGD